MSLKDWWTPEGWDRVLKNLNWLDIGQVKLAAFATGLFVASFFTDFVVQYRWWLLALAIVFSILPVIKSLK